MRQIYTFTSTYTADVSGVPSALYELGGMIVMHDASGCNSTYNTHDEPRWYGSKSEVFISGLSEIEAIMGDDEKLINDVIDAAKMLRPRFIAIAGTPIPMITGCDIEAAARVIESRTGIPTIGINTNGMHSYVEGAGEALLQYARKSVRKDLKRVKGGINVLGATPLDFSVNGQVKSIEDFLSNNGFKVISNFAFGTDYHEIGNASSASVNLVISSVGIKLADYFLKEFGIPYVVGVPYGSKLKNDIIKELHIYDDMGNFDKSTRFAKVTDKTLVTFATDIAKKQKNDKIYIIGESITSKSLAKCIYYKYGLNPSVISPVELGNTYHGDIDKQLSVRKNVALESGDFFIQDEDDIEKRISEAKVVIADPLYRPIVSQDTLFIENPHEAFSGRLFRKRILNLVDIL